MDVNLCVKANGGRLLGDLQERSILIIDDNLNNLAVIGDYLEDYGFMVFVSQDAESGLARARYAQPDLILLDVMMPGMDGFELCRRLKADEATCEIPVIFMTALSGMEHTVKGFAVGAVDYVTKPIQYEEVLARIQTHLTLRRLQQALQDANEVLEQRVAQRTAQLEARTAELEVRTTELAELNLAYECFVPKEFLNLLHRENLIEVQLGDQIQQDMTVMFADISSFTALSERMTPQENFNFLNSYLSRVSPIIRHHHGFIGQYVGDGMMALFPKDADDALQSAIEMQHEIIEYNIYRQRTEQVPIEVGMGIHSGSMMLGIIGEQMRKQGTVISDAVYVAAGLQQLTQQYGASIVISQPTLQRLRHPERYHYRFLGQVPVKGNEQGSSIFEVFDGCQSHEFEFKQKSKADFERGLSLYYEKEFAQSCVYFHQIVESNPQDKAAQLYLERAAHFMVHGVPAGWRGLEG